MTVTCDVNFSAKSCTCKIISLAGKQIGCIPANEHGLFRVEHAYATAVTTPVKRVDIHTLHRRLGHISADAICALIRNHAIEGIDLIDDGSPIICNSCRHAKMTRKIILKERKAPPTKRFGDEVHTDLWGPSLINSLGGRRYYITFTDDATRFTVANVLRTKDEALNVTIGLRSYADTLDCIISSSFFPYPEARVRYDLVFHSCTIRSCVLVGYDMISRLVSVRYQSQSHIYYDT